MHVGKSADEDCFPRSCPVAKPELVEECYIHYVYTAIGIAVLGSGIYLKSLTERVS
jgi:hypothetical protein